MIYDYHCKSCDSAWEENRLISERDVPLETACPACNESGGVTRLLSAPPLSYSGGGLKSNVTRAGSGWNDVLNKIKKGSGRKNSINSN
jgi:putative FmdB family regulatory protein